MSIPKHPLNAITEADLQALIDGGAREDRTLDFKRETYGGNDDSRAEFLADISAFANTLGGDLVLGMDEDQGTASALPGLQVDTDQEILRLTQIAQSGLQPRLPMLEMHAVPLASGTKALAIRVGRSYQGPHRVTFKGRNRFWARSSGGKYEPDVDELRALFTAAPQLAARIRELRADRIARVLAGETPIPLNNRPGLAIIHIIPFSAASLISPVVDLGRLRGQTVWTAWRASGYNDSRNLEGFVTYSAPEGQETQNYTQVFRSGMIEIVAAGLIMAGNGKGPIIWAAELGRRLIDQVSRIVPALGHAGVEPPYSVQLSLSGVRGVSFLDSNRNPALQFLHPPLPMKQDLVNFTDTVLTTDHVQMDQIAAALRPTLDQIFQAAACEGAPWFGPNGAFLKNLAFMM